MKNVIISLVISLFIALFLITGCAAGEPKAADQNTAGQIEEGYRVIEISKGFSADGISVYRGEELKIVYKGSSKGVSIEIPDFDISVSSNENTVEAAIKVKNEGEYELIAKEKNSEERGILSVQVYEKEAVFVNASPSEFEDAMAGDYFLLDVRTEEEYAEGYIEGATLISVYELAERLDEIEQYKETPVLVYCRSGNRSIVASQILIDEGFDKVYNLNGGITAWESYKQ